jgi:Bacterial cadherin-like domain
MTNEDTPVTVDVLANDRDPDSEALSVTAIAIPAGHGVAEATGTGVIYTLYPASMAPRAGIEPIEPVSRTGTQRRR